MTGSRKKIVVDAREFTPRHFTGIGRVLFGLAGALAEMAFVDKIILAASSYEAVPVKLKSMKRIAIKKVPGPFLASERYLTHLTKGDACLFLSPYPKLPLFRCHCPTIHTIHDVLYLTHPVYKRRFRASFDLLRLKMALRKADITWYDSSWSMKETKRLVGSAGTNPKVRHLGLNERFSPAAARQGRAVLGKYGLQPGYILVVGNGLPHKNLGVLLQISHKLKRRLVFVGVSQKHAARWKATYPHARGAWIESVAEEDLPGVITNAFCLAQPSTAEGYGYPPLEAMSCGVPAVVSDIPVLVETTGGHALTADPHEPEKWEEAFASLEDDALFSRQIDKGLKWVAPYVGQDGWRRHMSDIKELMSAHD